MVYSVCCLVLPEPAPPSKPEPVPKPAREAAKPSPAVSADTRGKRNVSHILALFFFFVHFHIHTLTLFTLSPLRKVHLCGAMMSVCWSCGQSVKVWVWSVPRRPHYKAWKSPSLLLSLTAARCMCVLVGVCFKCCCDRRPIRQKHCGFDPWGSQISSIISLLFFHWHLESFSSFYCLFPLRCFVPFFRVFFFFFFSVALLLSLSRSLSEIVCPFFPISESLSSSCHPMPDSRSLSLCCRGDSGWRDRHGDNNERQVNAASLRRSLIRVKRGMKDRPDCFIWLLVPL